MGIKPERLLSDNGTCYRSTAHAAACRELGLRHSFTRPYRPRTSGQAERFIKTLTERWAYGAIYATSNARTRASRLAHPLQRRHLSHVPPARTRAAKWRPSSPRLWALQQLESEVGNRAP
jgi:hypothetical protein